MECCGIRNGRNTHMHAASKLRASGMICLLFVFLHFPQQGEIQHYLHIRMLKLVLLLFLHNCSPSMLSSELKKEDRGAIKSKLNQILVHFSTSVKKIELIENDLQLVRFLFL